MRSRIVGITYAALLAACQSKSSAPEPAPPQTTPGGSDIAVATTGAAGTPGATADAAPGTTANAAADAAIVPPRAGAVDLGAIGTRAQVERGIRRVVPHGEHVYWAAQVGETAHQLRRVRRSGGAVEDLGALDAQDLHFAVLGNTLLVGGTEQDPTTKRPVATVFTISADGKLAALARVPTREVATRLVAHEGALYWYAANMLGGVGDIVVTRNGKTKQIVTCPEDPAHSPPRCELVVGTPPLLHRRNKLSTIDKGPRAIAAACPCDTGPVAVFGGTVVCGPNGVADACDSDVYPGDPGMWTLALPRGKPAPLEQRLGDEPQNAGGFVYHRRENALVRRAALGAADEPFAPLADLFAVDDAGVVWLAGDRLWAAPHK